MRKILATLGGVSAAAFLALFPPPVAGHGGDPEDMKAGLAASMRHPLVVTARSKAVQLTIVHQLRGCHEWTDGKRTAPGVRLIVERGTRLAILNADLDTHKLVQLAGPKLRLGPALRMSSRLVLRFRQPGVYRFMTEKVETPGRMDVKTVGPDHVLGLTVVVR